MKEFELFIIDRLIEILSAFCREGLTKEVIEKAKSLYDSFSSAGPLMSSFVDNRVEGLFPLGYPNIDQNGRIPTKKEIEKIIQMLTKRKQELEK